MLLYWFLFVNVFYYPSMASGWLPLLAEQQADWDKPACIPVSVHLGAIIHKNSFRNWILEEPCWEDPVVFAGLWCGHGKRVAKGLLDLMDSFFWSSELFVT